jgi:predicted RNA-binding Zn-ribbon protein involved in translation (DUF1610 family)
MAPTGSSTAVPPTGSLTTLYGMPLIASPFARIAEMTEFNESVMCPKCHTVVTAAPGWRLVACPKCGETISRMAEDSSYD